MKEHIEYIKEQQREDAPTAQVGNGFVNGHANGHLRNGHENTLQDLEVDSISRHVSNGVAHTVANEVKSLANGFTTKGNGHVPNGYSSGLPQYSSLSLKEGDNRQMYRELNDMDGHI